MASNYGIAIAGAGITGLATATALARAGFEVQVFDRAAAQPAPSNRIFTLNQPAWQLLREIGIGAPLARHPIRSMRLFAPDGHELRLAAADYGLALLGSTVCESDLQSALHRCATAAGIKFNYGQGLASLAITPTAVRATFGTREHVCALLVGADGSSSSVARAAGLRHDRQPFDQHALSGLAQPTRPQPGIAWQWLQAQGILALLPASRTTVSFIWSLPTAPAVALAGQSPAQLGRQLTSASGQVLGTLKPIGAAASYALCAAAHSGAANRIALVGDSLRVVHPLAGQGLCLGLGDALILARCARGGDPGHAGALGRYRRLRLLRSSATMAITSSLASVTSGHPLASQLLALAFRAGSIMPALAGPAIAVAHLP